MEIIQLPGRVLMIFEYDHLVRQIYTDGREHRTDLAPSWMGDAIGHWEGKTLVVETTQFNDKTWIDRIAVPHSEEMKLTERIYMNDEGQLQVDMRVEDPDGARASRGSSRATTARPTGRSKSSCARTTRPTSRSRTSCSSSTPTRTDHAHGFIDFRGTRGRDTRTRRNPGARRLHEGRGRRCGRCRGSHGTRAARTGAVDAARLRAADSEPGQWMSYGRTYDETRFSPLDADQHARTSASSALRGTPTSPPTAARSPRRSSSTACSIVTTAWSNVNAYDARTGKQLWDFDPKVPREWA